MSEEKPEGSTERVEAEAQAALDRADPAAAVRRLLRAERQAVLSTLSRRHHGAPFASLAPYALSRRGEPILLLASIAQHTRNIAADSRTCLLVQDRRAGADPQAGARATLIGRVHRVAPREREDARARYLASHPQADGYFGQHDFALYVHEIDEVRYIGGFGVLGWVPGRAVVVDPASDRVAPHAADILEHVNDDHAEALALLCRWRGFPGDGARLVGVDEDGIDVFAPLAGRVRFQFDPSALDPDDVRTRFVALVRAARQRVGTAEHVSPA